MAYTGRERWLTRGRVAALAVLVAAVALVEVTDPIHGLLYEYELVAEPFTYVATFGMGPSTASAAAAWSDRSTAGGRRSSSGQQWDCHTPLPTVCAGSRP